MLVKMPVPIMFDTTNAVALTTPSCRRSARFGEAMVHLCSFNGVNETNSAVEHRAEHEYKCWNRYKGRFRNGV